MLTKFSAFLKNDVFVIIFSHKTFRVNEFWKIKNNNFKIKLIDLSIIKYKICGKKNIKTNITTII